VPWKLDGTSQRGPARDRRDKWYYPQPAKRVTVEQAASFANVLRARGPRAPRADELVGKPVASFQVSESGKVASVNGLGRFANLDPATGNLPAYVYGQLPPDLPDGIRVAVAVNGRIGAVGTTARVGDQLHFAGLVHDESQFIPGRNQLDLLLVDQGGRSLRRLGTTNLG
jgi:hypothetical protein